MNSNILIYKYCCNDQSQKIRELLKNNSQDIDIMYKDALFFRVATAHNNVEIMSTLLEYFTQTVMNSDDIDLSEKHTLKNSLKEALESARDANYLSDEMSCTISSYIESSEEDTFAEELLEKNKLIPAIRLGKCSEVNEIIDQERMKGNLDLILAERNRNEESPLMCAIKRKMFSIAKDIILLDQNLDYSVPETGKTAMMYAAEQGRKDLIEVLFKKGASLYIRDKSGDTVIEYSQNHETIELIKSLDYSTDELKKQDAVQTLHGLSISQLDDLLDSSNCCNVLTSSTNIDKNLLGDISNNLNSVDM